MLKNLMQLALKIENWEANLHFDPSTPLAVLEQMAVQFIQIVGQYKAQALAAQQASPAPAPEPSAAPAIVSDAKTE